MNNFAVRVALAAVITLGAIALASSTRMQRQPSDQASAAAGPQQTPTDSQGTQNPSAVPSEPPVRPSAPSNEPQMPVGKLQPAQSSFNGRIVQENGKILLKNIATRKTYEIDNVGKVRGFMGKQVKVTGRRDPHSGRIHVENVVRAS